MRFLKLVLVFALIFVFLHETASQQTSKIKTSRKAPKYHVTVLGGFNYVLGSANGDGKGFSSDYNLPQGNLFNSDNLGMQQGYGALVIGKIAVDKKRKTRVTGSLGYNMFYNSNDQGRNRTRWNMFNLGAGVEYNFTPKQRQRLFVGAELDYTLMFGAWQSDITYPDGYVSNIYTKFNPVSRLGMAATAGMEFRLSKKTDLVVAIRGMWANAFPKSNSYTDEPYQTYTNDSSDNNGIQFDDRKEIIFMQAFIGINLPIR